MLIIEAPAKLNLTLAVNGRRPDGYHLIESVMQTIDLTDCVELVPTAGGTAVRCEGPDGVPTDETNLAARAVEALRRAAPPDRGQLGGLEIRIRKRIPVAAGLGGGSANAAAALIGANALWQLGLDQAALARVGVQLGADIPFCLHGGTAVARGIGEVLAPVPAAPPLAGVVVNPGFPVSTAEVYRQFDQLYAGALGAEVRAGIANGAAGGATGSPAAPRFLPGAAGRAAAMVQALQRRDVAAVARLLHNDLEPAAARLYPEIARLREQVLRAGALGAVMCGSGPTVFGLAADADHARELARRLADAAPFVVPCRFRDQGCRVVQSQACP
ncbi:MAG: 4-(cytidine 5'-diphospho)-2-C-methyl-D-erythritol kinase [Limnochordales bacterium]|nr:4-(cytidine 5'-diphospho)-2-C-methyl-D-erythritol kinase [Limnochordales bacterium]